MMINTVSPRNTNSECNPMIRRFSVCGKEKHLYQVVTVTSTGVVAKRKFPKEPVHIMTNMNVEEVRDLLNKYDHLRS
jgi:hypothetical protein